ncbi:MAG: hypothetical protein M3R01_12185, partial [Actinomycetota bacterium]|nr:hypothetical protein [Actinomycetota bacterium]
GKDDAAPRRRTRFALVAAAAVLVAGAAVAAGALLGDDEADDPAAGDVLAVGDALFAVVAGGTEQRLVEVDPDSAQVARSSEARGFPLSATVAVDADGAETWALTGQRRGVRAYQVEETPENRLVIQVQPSPTLAGKPVAIEVAEGFVWVLHGTPEQLRLTKIDADEPGRDPEAQSDLAETDDPAEEVQGSLAVGPFGAWATSGGRSLTRFEPALGQGLDVDLPARALSLAADQEFVWVATDDGRVLRFDGDEPGADFEGYGVADGVALTSIAVEADVWVASADGRVWRLPRDPDRPPAPVDMPDGAKTLAVGGGYLWFLLGGPDGELGRVSLEDGGPDPGTASLSEALEEQPAD